MPTMVDFQRDLAWELIENKLFVKKNALINLLDNVALHLYMQSHKFCKAPNHASRYVN